MTPRTSADICGMGHSMKRKEDPRFIRGQGHYVDDIKLPGMLHLAIVRSPYAHARIVAIHTEKALKVPGVLAVITVIGVARVEHVHPPAGRMIAVDGGRRIGW